MIMENKTILKPEYILPYLPYELRVMMEGKACNVAWMSTKNIAVIRPHTLGDIKKIKWGYAHLNVKPLLKPLDHIDKEEFDNRGLSELEELGVDYIGGGIVYMVNKHGLDLDGEAHFFGTDKHLPTIPWDIIQVFLKNHYDVFGLIEQGLAYDYNELNK